MPHSSLPSALAVLLFAGVCSAQMSGSYTINPTGNSSRNFKSFGAAANALNAAGVNGPVVFHVRPGTITESWTMPRVRGTSQFSTITFQGVASPPSLFLNRLIGTGTTILKLAPGVNNVILDGFDFVSTTRGNAISGDANNGGGTTLPISFIEIRNCRFGTGIAGLNGQGHIYVLGGGQSSHWSIHDCIFNMGAYVNGIYLQHMSACRLFRNRFHVTNTRHGVFMENMSGPDSLVCNNLFTGSVRSPSSACVLYVWAGRGVTDICFNTFRVAMSGAAICTSGSPIAFNRIYGNIMSVQGFGRGFDVRNRGHFRSDGNLFHIQSGIIGKMDAASYSGLIAWRNATATKPGGMQDRNSITGDPRFRSATDLHLTAASPGVGKAVIMRGRYDPRTDFDGFIRGGKQDVGAFELAGYRLYGAGCPGGRGVVPRFSIGGNIGPSDLVSIDLDDGRPSSPAVLSIGAPKAKIPTGPGCNLLHSPLLLFYTRSNAAGAASSLVKIPSGPASGLSVFLQWAVQDPAAPTSLALSPGAEVRF